MLFVVSLLRGCVQSVLATCRGGREEPPCQHTPHGLRARIGRGHFFGVFCRGTVNSMHTALLSICSGCPCLQSLICRDLPSAKCMMSAKLEQRHPIQFSEHLVVCMRMSGHSAHCLCHAAIVACMCAVRICRACVQCRACARLCAVRRMERKCQS